MFKKGPSAVENASSKPESVSMKAIPASCPDVAVAFRVSRPKDGSDQSKNAAPALVGEGEYGSAAGVLYDMCGISSSTASSGVGA